MRKDPLMGRTNKKTGNLFEFFMKNSEQAPLIKDLSDFEREFIDGTRVAGAAAAMTAQLASVSIGTRD